jgi:hypothetical protein
MRHRFQSEEIEFKTNSVEPVQLSATGNVKGVTKYLATPIQSKRTHLQK